MTLANTSPPQGKLPSVAVVGCGAAAREFCLPVLTRYAGFRDAIVIVDVELARAKTIASEFGIRHYCDDYRSLPHDVDAAIITTPHRFHAEQSVHFLQQGKPVFVEKPLGMTAAEVASMLAASEAGDATLMVNNCRRLFPAYRAVRDLLQARKYGAVLRVEINDGSPFAWKSASAFYVRDAKSSRGVFLDRGAHTIDILCWWLSVQPKVVTARSDAVGGAEAVMDVDLECGEASIQLKFSRLYKLANSYRITCDAAQIGGRLFDSSRLQVVRNGKVNTVVAGPPAVYDEYARKLVDNFVGVVQDREPALFVAQDVAPSISVIEEAYRLAKPFESPWYISDPNLESLKEWN